MTDPAPAGNLEDVPLEDALGERYLAYALATITSRSLPDVRDGLKPVHRRLLYAMQQLRLDPASGFKKCARVVGDVIGKYHPHGDTAVYDALVRLAQDFAARYPLVEGQGNFGNIDGDGAAAMRYTEARLTEYAQAMLAGIDEDAVDFRDTYDGSESEPVLLPASVPNLLANGAAGIAVGMATSVPPHNLDEICLALQHLIRFPRATIEKLVSFMPGPDLPTGGVLVESPDAVIEAYTTGRGSFRLRARWEVETLARGQYRIIVTEIPYQVQKGRLVEKIAELLMARKLPMLDDVRDESTDDIRLVLEPRNRTVEAGMLMESLFQHTDLETRLGLNMNVLDADTVPRVMNLREVLQAYLDHRHEVLLRRTKFRLARIERRIEILSGYLIVYLNLDEVIRIIRNEDRPKPVMMKRWKLSDLQAEAILDMRLRALRRLEEIAIKQELDKLKTEKNALGRLLKDEKARWACVADEIGEARKAFGTKTGAPPSAVVVPLEVMIEREPITVIFSEKGWLRTARGHLEDSDGLKFKEGDRSRFILHAQTTDRLLLLGTNGRFYTLGCDKLPSGRGHGDPVRLVTGLGNDDDVVELFVHVPGRKLLVASSDGRGFVVPEDEVMAQTRTGKQVLNVSGDVEARALAVAEGDTVAVVGDNHKLILFPLAELPEMSRGRGVLLQRYKDGGLADVKVFTLEDGLSWRSGERTRTETDLRLYLGKRAQSGRLAPRGFPRSNRFS